MKKSKLQAAYTIALAKRVGSSNRHKHKGNEGCDICKSHFMAGQINVALALSCKVLDAKFSPEMDLITESAKPEVALSIALAGPIAFWNSTTGGRKELPDITENLEDFVLRYGGSWKEVEQALFFIPKEYRKDFITDAVLKTFYILKKSYNAECAFADTLRQFGILSGESLTKVFPMFGGELFSEEKYLRDSVSLINYKPYKRI